MGSIKSNLSQMPLSIQNLIKYLISSQIVRKIVLFGSRARGSARENSDYDIALWVDDRDKWTSFSASIEEQNLTLLPVDLVLYDEISSEYQNNIDREGLLIYG